MRIELTDKPIAIAGASSGIGAALAEACARVGMPVTLGARRVDRLEALAAKIRDTGGRAHAVPCDVTNTQDCERLIDETEAEFGPVYAACANAGYGYERPVLDDLGALRAIFETNVWGSVHIAAVAAERMRAHGRGHILMTSSCLAKLGVPYYGPYCATKAVQDHLGRAMRHELRAEGIAVSTVHPIGTKTEFFDTAAAGSPGNKLRFATPDRLAQKPERVARAIVKRLRTGRGGEIWTSTPAQLAFALVDVFPSLTDRVLGAMVKKRG